MAFRLFVRKLVREQEKIVTVQLLGFTVTENYICGVRLYVTAAGKSGADDEKTQRKIAVYTGDQNDPGIYCGGTILPGTGTVYGAHGRVRKL